MINKIELECLPKDIPDEIVVDLAGLEIGDSIAAGDLDITKDERFKMLTSAESLLVNVTAPTLQAEAEEEEAGEESVEVPVIGKEEE
jgi:large subunit ribosomal protein L25